MTTIAGAQKTAQLEQSKQKGGPDQVKLLLDAERPEVQQREISGVWIEIGRRTAGLTIEP